MNINKSKRVLKFLRKNNLKPTTQRILLSKILFNGKDMHFCAEDLKNIILKKGHKISLATIYNNLQSFTDAGLLKQRRVSNQRIYFDNNIKNHYHFYDEENDNIYDIPSSSVKFLKLPKLPKNKKIKSLDLVINLTKK